MARKPTPKTVFRLLFRHYGGQQWWPGDSAFEIMVGAVLTQNTAWTNVEKAIANLKRAGALDPLSLVTVHPRRLAAWLKPSGYFNVKAKRLRALCHWVVEQGGVRRIGRIDTGQLRDSLLGVHGIGPETADDILLYAFDRPVFVIDAYTRRIFRRLGLVAGDEPYEQLRAWFERRIDPEVGLYNEYHALLVIHGKDVCRPRPKCDVCPLMQHCPRFGVARP